MGMTGKDLIVYILENNLMDEPICKDGTFIGYIPIGKAAEEMGMGIAGMKSLLNMYEVDCVTVGGIFVPYDYKKCIPKE